MKRKALFFCILLLFGFDSVCLPHKMVDHPDLTRKSMNYVDTRFPLQPVSFIKLPVGSIHPTGWVGKYLTLQRDGLTGHLNEISGWLAKNNNAWLTSVGDHGWEEVPYWLRGYGDLAYILRDQKMLKETKFWIRAVLKSQKADGSFGPVNLSDGKPELWAHMIMLNVLQSYYEYSGDKSVISFMTKFFKWELSIPNDKFLKNYWENSRGGDNMMSVLWLYNITGDKFLLSLALKIHNSTANWCQKSTLPNWHNVNIAQGFREPATYYSLTGDSSFLSDAYNNQKLVRRIFGQVPGGMFGADENARMGYIDPRQGVELCGMVEQMASDEYMLRLTGDPYWAANCEDITFNTYPASVMPDFRALRYITAPNMIVSDSRNHHPSIDNNGPFLSMNPFSSRCCQHNHSQGWPYYAENLIYATPDNGVAIALYGSCRTNMLVADRKRISIIEKTQYPFDEKIHITLRMKGKAEFPVYLRIPLWTKNPTISINGNGFQIFRGNKKYLQINRLWKDGDEIALQLPMSIQICHWPINQNSVSVNYGPVTFSLKIKERYVNYNSEEHALSDSQWQKGVDSSKWPAYDIYADSPWNYALHLDANRHLAGMKIVWRSLKDGEIPFTQENAPIEIQTEGSLIPSWKTTPDGMCGVLPEENSLKLHPKMITLIPMGAARLRIAAFPIDY
jgi:hypothetical protein